MFDPDGPSAPSLLFGLECDPGEALVCVLPVPFDATTSGRRGTVGGPEGVRYASGQVDLHDLEYGDFWRAGITLAPIDPRVSAWNAEARDRVDRARATGDAGAHARVDAIGDALEELVATWTARTFEEGRIPAILGGDHSVPLGAQRAAAARHPGLGVLHVDAHADMRAAYEGFKHSHASIFYNLLGSAPRPELVVQVGIRDVGPAEWARVSETPGLRAWTDFELAGRLAEGATWSALVAEILEPLPRDVWISFDIDGLDPALCPSTGTPVPGGLGWRQATTLLSALVASGRRIVGFDLVEVGPDDWDCNVGARLLYKLSGAAVRSRHAGAPARGEGGDTG